MKLNKHKKGFYTRTNENICISPVSKIMLLEGKIMIMYIIIHRKVTVRLHVKAR